MPSGKTVVGLIEEEATARESADSALQSAVAQIENVEPALDAMLWEQGGISTSTGLPIEGTSKSRCLTYYKESELAKLKNPNLRELYGYKYTLANNVYTFVEAVALYTQTEYEFNIESDYYWRFAGSFSLSIANEIQLYKIYDLLLAVQKIDGLSSDVERLENGLYYPLDESMFEQGGINTEGGYVSSNNFIRTKTYISQNISKLTTSGSVYIKVYKNNAFVGNYNGELPITTSVHMPLTGDVSLLPVYTVDNAYRIKIVYTNGSSTSPQDADDISCTEPSIISLSKDSIETLIGAQNIIGEKVSIYGDSISTFAGWVPSGNAVYYTGSNAGVTNVNQTWWKRVIDTLGLTLVVNNSWSGRAVSSIRDGETAHSTDAGYKETNVLQLKNGSILPDIIIVKLGINDFNNNAILGDYDGSSALPIDPTKFLDAYAIMLNLIMTNFPLADVYCCTLMQCERTGSTGFPEINSNGDSLITWNNAIKTLAHAFGAKVLDHDICGITYYNLSTYMGDYSSGTGLHPNASGHSLIANQTLHDMM